MAYLSTLFFVILIFFSTGESGLASDMKALMALHKAMGGRSRLRHWNLSDATPCSWLGVTCNGDHVTELRLPGVGLVGQLPLGLGNLTQLKTLSLRLNALSGPLPSDFSNLLSLQHLYLQRNLFSGEIPEVLFSIKGLVRLNLANNNYAGPISTGFNNLTKLEVLYLENNQLSGSIPDLNNIPTLKTLNVSFNHLNGSIPSKFADNPVSAFEGNSLCGKPLQPCEGDSGKKKLSSGAIAGIVVGSLIAFLILLILFFFCGKRCIKSGSSPSLRDVEAVSSGRISLEVENRNTGTNVKSDETEKERNLVFCGNVERVFDLDELLRASAEVLGRGTFGTTYKANLDSGSTVIVKRLRDGISEEEFKEKVESLGMMNHQNLVPVKGYYYSRDEKLLVSDYVPMGSLSVFLHGSREAGRSPLKWEERAGIALASARGISYLHSRRPPTSHGNIKSSNILLNRSYKACVSDFGLIQIARPAASTPNHATGYRAPEVTDPRKVSQKADVYSFGVLILEILTGKALNSPIYNDEIIDLPRWVHSKVEEKKTAEVFDMELLEYKNGLDEMVQLLHLAMLCTAPHPDSRPSMPKVTSRIDEIYRSVLLKEQETGDDIFNDGDSTVSQRFYSADLSMPPSSS